MNIRLALPSCLVLATVALFAGCGDDPIAVTDTVDGLTILDTGTPIDRDAVVVHDSLTPDTGGGTDTAVGEDTHVASCDDEPKPYFCPCENNVQCASGYCIPVGEQVVANRCTRTCSDACPDGWDCRGTTGADPVFICQPPINNLCEPCTTDAQCGTAGDRCVTFEDGRYCGRDCQDAPSSCPPQYVCGEVTAADGQILAYQCLPESESCNCPVGTDYDNDPNHCGGCNKPCVYPGGVAGCALGQCRLDDCQGGFKNLNGDDSDGCEYACSGTEGADDWPDAVCNGSDCDQDCDGLDGTWTRGVFVAPNGGTNATGAPSDPIATVSAGITKAKATGKDHVYIAAGTYNEQVAVQDGVSLFGGYSNDGKWTRNLAQYTTVVTSSSGFSSVRALVIENVQNTRTVIDGLSAVGGTNANPGGSSYGIWVKDCSNKLELVRVTAIGGNGGAGQSGSGGAPGNPGNDGDPGTNSTTWDYVCAGDGCDFNFSGKGGAGGVNACSSGRNAGGGAGATPPNCATGAASGATSPGGTPGGAGETAGSNGDPGTHGPHGSGGQGAGDVSAAGFWQGADGSDGTVGQNATGGGGGGSGRSIETGAFDCSRHYGGGGGGGGGGGCGGQLGGSGRAGGGSFGVLLYNANPTLMSCGLGHKSGGNGGSGGMGGAGGGGKQGRPGGQGWDEASDGAKGGNGGNGGNGGHGGGGAGGVAFGLYIAGTSSPTCTGLSYSPPGAGGTGGLGGVGGNASGNKGADGLQGDKNKGTASCQ